MSSAGHRFQAPKGTRDVYPEDLLRRRFITESWRRASIRFGFDEIDGPTFEHLDLYTVKSGEGIVSELFSFQRQGGETTFALRPEFTPSLARMFASKAGTLPKPVKWFMAGPFFRAERPQRGRLREFLQWNLDVIGGDDEASKARADAEVISCGIDLMASMGLTPEHVKVHLNDRSVMAAHLESLGVAPERTSDALTLLDKRGKLDASALAAEATAKDLEADGFLAFLCRDRDDPSGPAPGALEGVRDALRDAGVDEWCVLDFNIARGLAYYTGTVFEFVADGERAVCGGGRYD
ncbi:MAG: ATP phosphoribosyltransferase regulatory subunit, partial [Phycisphaerales bacterium]|nr:ATP phosphoribosyltransferase regulatory subunit [Phycisphaerales bacterium]